jgi:hypothetical protein
MLFWRWGPGWEEAARSIFFERWKKTTMGISGGIEADKSIYKRMIDNIRAAVLEAIAQFALSAASSDSEP